MADPVNKINNSIRDDGFYETRKSPNITKKWLY